jgi:putative ABC transport system substrate-binding protein
MRLCLRRREFITLLGGAAAWPLAASAQQGDRVRRIGLLIAPDEHDPAGKTQLSAFMHALSDLGWTAARNMRMDLRWDPNHTPIDSAARRRDDRISAGYIGL